LINVQDCGLRVSGLNCKGKHSKRIEYVRWRRKNNARLTNKKNSVTARNTSTVRQVRRRECIERKPGWIQSIVLKNVFYFFNFFVKNMLFSTLSRFKTLYTYS
jgi:hypothetical protein